MTYRHSDLFMPGDETTTHIVHHITIYTEVKCQFSQSQLQDSYELVPDS